MNICLQDLVVREGVSIGDLKMAVQTLSGNYEEKTVIPTEEEQIIRASIGKDAISKVIVKPIPSEYTKVEGTLDINEEGECIVKSYEKANVSIDLSNELTEQDALLTTQETTIEDVINALQDKSAGDPSIEDGLIDGSLTGAYTNNRIKTLRNYAFSNTKITAFNSTSLEEIAGQYAFNYCSNLEECNVPNLTSVQGGNIWNRCQKLKRLELPKLTSWPFSSSNCSYCTALTYVNLGEVPHILSYAFSNCTNLQYLVLPRATEITALGNTNAFSKSGIANGTGFVYVPDELVDTYKTATNWSTYADQIKPLSELPEGV